MQLLRQMMTELVIPGSIAFLRMIWDPIPWPVYAVCSIVSLPRGLSTSDICYQHMYKSCTQVISTQASQTYWEEFSEAIARLLDCFFSPYCRKSI